jgi:hypothetical protein
MTFKDLSPFGSIKNIRHVHCFCSFGAVNVDHLAIVDFTVLADTSDEIAEVMGDTLLLGWPGETFELFTKPFCLQPVAAVMNMTQGEWQ